MNKPLRGIWWMFSGAMIGMMAGYSAAQAPLPQESILFQQDTGGYHTYRIPAIIATKKNALIAFCEGRKNGKGDTGDIDLLYRRSEDGGKSWGDPAILWDDGEHCCGNPAPVVDRESGRIHLLMTWNRGEDKEKDIIAGTSHDTRHVYVAFSDDDGKSWSRPKDITATTKQPDWTWCATGPGAGIQMEQGPHKGRLVIPCDFVEAETKRYYSYILFSDDHGEHWRAGGRTADKVNECQAAELPGGILMLNMRNYDREKHCRQVALSRDGGMTWEANRFDTALIEPVCQASLRRYAWPKADTPGVLLFSNPADPGKRVRMTIRASRDDGTTWPLAKVLFDGPSAYSDLVTLPEGPIGCLYEAGKESPYETIRFARFDFDWLTGP